MTRLARLTALIALTALPLAAQEAEAPEEDNNPSLLEQGAQLFLRGLMEEMEPGINDLQDLAEGIGPALEGFADHMGATLVEIMRIVDDIENYEQPEFLPNGDIIIRRSPDAPPFTPPEVDPDAELAPDEEIEL